MDASTSHMNRQVVRKTYLITYSQANLEKLQLLLLTGSINSVSKFISSAERVTNGSQHGSQHGSHLVFIAYVYNINGSRVTAIYYKI